MPTYRAQCTIPFFTNLPSDVQTNTLHFDPLTPLGFEETADIVQPRLIAFYQACYTALGGIASYAEEATAYTRWYDLEQPMPRVPYELPMPFTATGTTSPIPTEVAAVISFQGDPFPGMPQARRRGRIYLGCIPSQAMDLSAASQYPRFSNTAVAGLAAAADSLRTTVDALGVRWTVWSPTDGLASVITNGWVDNSPDTQRRRSVDPTARTLWS